MTVDPGRAERLRAFVDTSVEPVAWGMSDCSAWVADWIVVERGRPLRRPQYSTREEAMALIAANANGLVGIWSDIARHNRLDEVSAPQVGDVGVIRLFKSDVGAIFAADGIAMWRNEAGGAIFIRPKTILRAWTV